jgi:hypothetical protein
MKNLLVRIAIVGAMTPCLLQVGQAQDKSGWKASVEPKYHYAFRHVLPDGSETSTMNWDGSINWDNHQKRNELWIQRDGKTFLILDKATLDAFWADFTPLRDFNLQRSKYMDGYYEARGNQRGVEHSGRSLDRQIQSNQRRLERAKSDDEKAELKKEIQDLQNERTGLESQQKDADKKLEAETKKREEFYRKREEIRAKVYKQTDKLVDDAIAKGLAKPGVPG